MANFIITTKPRFVNLFKKTDGCVIIETGKEINTDIVKLTRGDTTLYVTACIPDQFIPAIEKHNTIAYYLDIIAQHDESLDKENTYLILHDKDIVETHRNGVIYEREISKVSDSTIENKLVNRIKDGHLYLYMHEDMQIMFESLIKQLSNIQSINFDEIIQIIENNQV